MDILSQWLQDSQLPLLSALLLGLMTAISPCPLATNITAVGFISKDIKSRRKVFYNGVVYTLGRSLTYVGIGLLLIVGVGQMQLSTVLAVYGERIIGPLLLVIGIFMLGVINIPFPGIGFISEKVEDNHKNSFLGVLLMGIVFALAFCPYSGVLYFGALIPMSIGSGQGIPMLLLFALATGLPVIILSWMLAFTVNKVGTFYNRVKSFEKWFRKFIAILFILVGTYYIITVYF
ncbi:MAG: aromatic aminobenezylarsenical efflux permease ArsG family transporter [Bacteroidales bacterium]